jgi:hypothetical protein
MPLETIKRLKRRNIPAQLPVESKKKPVVHLAQAVPLSAVVHPARQVHFPFDPHRPFSQLQIEGGLMTVVVKHRPLPEIPSSQDVQPLGHDWHVGPKKPDAQDSHEVPLKPEGQVHEPEAEQTPDPEQGGEHAADCMSTREREATEPDGS